MPDGVTAPEVGSNIVRQLDTLFEPWNRSDAPGLTVCVTMDGAVIYRRGFGMASLETGVANTPKTRMRIASTTKHFTALLALLLAEEGLLDLDASIRTYIPELVGPDGEPSLRLLLQHRGGIRCSSDIGFLGHGMTLPPIGTTLATHVRQTSVNFRPGQAMIYNNGGYQLVSIAIERVGGAPFEEQLKTRLFDPVGMVDTVSAPSDYNIIPGIATMHLPIEGGGWRRGMMPSEECRGAGAIVSTVDDMLRWTAHLRSRNLFGSPDTWAELTELPIYPDETVGSYALGLMIDSYRGLGTLHHAGGWIGGSSEMLTIPDAALDVVILANGAPKAMPDKLARQVVDIVLAGRLGEPPPAVSTTDRERLLGDWWSADTGMIYGLVDTAGSLALSFCGSPSTRTLERHRDGRVIAPAYDLGEIEVDLDEVVAGGDLTITFGGLSAPYRKVSEASADTATFARTAIGTFYSHDADITATITGRGERLVIALSDAFGRVEADLCPVDEFAALIRPLSPLMILHAAITLDRSDGDIVGFRLSSARTRNLAFRRI